MASLLGDTIGLGG